LTGRGRIQDTYNVFCPGLGTSAEGVGKEDTNVEINTIKDKAWRLEKRS
jgi:hypothetical protein